MTFSRTGSMLCPAAGFAASIARSLGALALLILPSSGTARATTWDLSNDFSFSANPNGPWSYGDFNGLPSAGGTFAAYGTKDTSISLNADIGGATLGPLDIWSPGGTDPNVNYNPFNVSANYNTNVIYWDPHQVNFSSSGAVASGTEWTAPVTGLYNVTAKFWNAQDSSAQNEYVDQASTVAGVTIGSELFHGTTTNTPGPTGSASAITYSSLTPLLILAGTQIDFLSTSGQNVGVSATITSAVPEPGTGLLAVLAAFGLAALVRHRRRVG